MKTFSNILEDDEQIRPNGPVSSEENVQFYGTDDIVPESAEQADAWNISLIGPELRTIRQEEVFLLLHILPPSVLALIEQAAISDSSGKTATPVGDKRLM